jgi:hypothetical protein
MGTVVIADKIQTVPADILSHSPGPINVSGGSRIIETRFYVSYVRRNSLCFVAKRKDA